MLIGLLTMSNEQATRGKSRRGHRGCSDDLDISFMSMICYIRDLLYRPTTL